ncbi:hypothetical protein HAX54_008844, partial [Datura stramonium]|nr:hypothetical protein [Datura stramonium]
MLSKFQPTRGGAQSRNDRTETKHHPRDENTNLKRRYRRLGMRKHRWLTKLDPLLDSILLLPSLMSEMILQQTDLVQEGLTATVRGHLKRSIAEKVKIIDSAFSKYPNIERRYKFYGFGWMSLCKEAHVPLIAGIDVETPVTKKYHLEKSKDETRYDLKLHKPVIEVLVFDGQSARVAEATTNPARAATATGAITAALESYMSIHVHINNVETQSNDRLKELIVPDLAKFAAELKKGQDDILELQQERMPQEFPIPASSRGDDEKILGVMASSESQTHVKPPPEIEVVHH